jgi:hypothetical protein
VTKASPARIKKRVNSGPQVELSHPDSHPVAIGQQFNGLMGKWELVCIVGNFDSEDQARAYGQELLGNEVFQNARAVQ